MSSTVNQCTKYVRAVLRNTKEIDAERYRSILARRVASGQGSVTGSLSAGILEYDLMRAEWFPYYSSSFANGVSGYVTHDIHGCTDVVRLSDLDDTDEVTLRIVPVRDGNVSVATDGLPRPAVDYTILTVFRPINYTDDVVMDLHPGHAATPTEKPLPRGHRVGDTITSAEAMRLGFTHAAVK